MKRQIFYKVLIACIVLSTVSIVNAQNTVGGRNAGGIDINTKPGGTVQEIKKERNKVVGSKYLSEEWTKGSIELSGGNNLNNVLLRYDIENGIVEILDSEDKVKVINETFIDYVQIVSSKSAKDELLVNGKNFYINNVPLTGLVLSEQLKGKFNLITRFEIKRTDSNYVSILDAGKEENVISIEKRVYLAEGKTLTEIPGSKKKVISMLASDVDADSIKSYINKNDLNVKKYTDLIFILNYVNSQVK